MVASISAGVVGDPGARLAWSLAAVVLAAAALGACALVAYRLLTRPEKVTPWFPFSVAGQDLFAPDGISLEDVASVYRHAFERGAAPTVAVSEHFEVGYPEASSLVTRARAAGLLPPTTRGRASA
jgi:hypothetical protein